MSHLDDFTQFIADQSTLLTIGSTGNLLKTQSLDSPLIPNTCAVVYEMPGRPPMHAFSTSNQADRVMEQPRMQVVCRSTSYQTAYTLARDVFHLVDGYSGVMPTGSNRQYAWDASMSPYSMGRDQNDRWLVGLFFDGQVFPAHSTGSGGGSGGAFDSAFGEAFAI